MRDRVPTYIRGLGNPEEIFVFRKTVTSVFCRRVRHNAFHTAITDVYCASPYRAPPNMGLHVLYNT